MNSPPELVVASRNRKKISELEALLSALETRVVSVSDFPGVPDVVEDGTSFAENAAKKASQTASFLGRWALGEDSGLEVDALGGAPGVYSARYSGPEATDVANNSKLIAALQGVPVERRGARYVCHVAVADPEGRVQLHIERYCRGRIVDDPRGSNGFGYDPHFLIPEYHRTFGELSPLVKQQLSHRARALRWLLPALHRLWD
ncbi:MAG: RdgB/HAM1 family non-canonical purine NTP pyrophosphatase [Planctomycetaceae bacterium]|nr:RdgB/HAM1 family non-canonical purine NTP pyrophosphatase [Planctomycetaceae bacterium]